ncbi:hypothetical protein DSO57_1002982 [Entomophthora muscae]|uniref:Uncharacterized protein n=1 Tax=Entomophthora muscae TaxID=34485 RepID=A0ACC2U854_9FUNG|nr:hypothetical protein DSO57_1002982 [Entomophthora muscae]
MVNHPKRNRKPVIRYTNVPEQRINQTQRGIPKIPVGNIQVYSPILASEEAEFTEILGGKIDTAFYSLSSTVSYKTSTSSSKPVVQDSGMPTSSQLSTIAKKRSRSNKSKATTTTPTDKTNESVPSLTNLLQNFNKGEGLKWAFIHSQKEDPLRNLLVYGPGSQRNNMDLSIIGVLQQYFGLLVLGLGLLHLKLGLQRLRIRLLRRT